MKIFINVVKNFFDPQYHDHLPYVEKARELFELILDLQKLRGMAFAKLNWFAKRLDITKRYVQKLLKVLRDAQLIEVKRREQNYYRVNPLLISSSSTAQNSSDNQTQRRAPRTQAAQQAQAQLELGANNQHNPLPAVAVEAVESAAAAPSAPTVESMDEPPIDPAMQEAVEEAAKEVKKARKNVRPKSIADYLDLVKARLAMWEIEAPRLLISDVVVKFWKVTWQ